MEVEVNGKKVKVKANAQKELTVALESAQKFIAEKTKGCELNKVQK
ncbi:hypothetical protein [Aphanizomenon sp. CS-733/32]|nr:hypothetical protein [Aphanizomenon sp. CS-733/32]